MEYKPVEELKYEEAFTELENILKILESGDEPLDVIMAVFTRGQELISYCSTLLAQAELKITQLNETSG
jgi:exodeoxyribonuclease VII small subunit